MTTLLTEIETQIASLSTDEQLWLVERLAHHLRRKATVDADWESDLAAMAADASIQAELRKIEEEFAGTEADGLGTI